MSDELQLPRAARVVHVLCRAAARQRLCGRAGADHGLPGGDRAAGAAQHRSTSAGPDWRRWRRRRSGARPTTGCSTSIFSGSEAIDRAERGRRGSGPPAGGRPRRGRNAAGRRSQRIRPGRGARARRWSSAALRQARPAMRCADCRARRPARLPRRRGHRRMRARRGPCADLRRTLRDSVRNDGEVLRLGRLKRRPRPRKMLLLIDVSGSMKARTDDNMKLAHALLHAAPRRRGVHLRHPADPRHPRAAAQAPRAGAGRGRASGQRLGRRHPDRRCAAGVSRRAALRRLRARRRRRHRLRRAGARRSVRAARRGRQIVAPRLAPELADAARRRSRLSAADRGADRDPPLRR